MAEAIALICALALSALILFLTVGAWAIGIVRIFSWALGI